MRLVVDVYNVLHAWAGLGDGGEPSVERLADLLGGSRYGQCAAKLVCDGASPHGQPERTPLRVDAGGRVVVIYAGPGRDADSLIEDLIEASHGPRELVVVSSDRRIQRAAKRRRAAPRESAGFMLELLSDGREPRQAGPAQQGDEEKSAGRAEVAAWMRYFGLATKEEGPAAAVGPPSGRNNDELDSVRLPRADEAALLRGIDPAELDMQHWMNDVERDDEGQSNEAEQSR